MNLLRRFHALFWKRKLETDMAAEMRAHLEEQTQRNLAAGLALRQARDTRDAELHDHQPC